MRVDLRQAAAAELEFLAIILAGDGACTSIGGIVRDEEGRPIEGVSVKPYETSPQDRVRESIDLTGVSARTDPQGRWHVDLMPEGFDLGDLQFTFSHPEFLDSSDSSRLQPNPTPEELGSLSSVTVLYRGISVTGRVLDQTVIRSPPPRFGSVITSGVPALKTDADGRFRFRNAAGG